MVALDAMLDESVRSVNRPLAFAIVDEHGELVAFARMDGTTTFVRDMALKKAYTAAYVGSNLPDFETQRKSRGRAVSDYANPSLIGSAAGGVVLRTENGDVLGGIGVSGASPPEDERIARVGLEALQRAGVCAA
jgi:glc operon protein GlcG